MVQIIETDKPENFNTEDEIGIVGTEITEDKEIKDVTTASFQPVSEEQDQVGKRC